jgi:uncharacterized protein Veg
MDEEKSANQLWKESGTSLSFANWIEREKIKGQFVPNKQIVSAIKSDIKATIRKEVGLDKEAGEKDNTKALGLSKMAIYGSLLIIAGAIAYKIYQKRK